MLRVILSEAKDPLLVVAANETRILRSFLPQDDMTLLKEKQNFVV